MVIHIYVLEQKRKLSENSYSFTVRFNEPKKERKGIFYLKDIQRNDTMLTLLFHCSHSGRYKLCVSFNGCTAELEFEVRSYITYGVKKGAVKKPGKVKCVTKTANKRSLSQRDSLSSNPSKTMPSPTLEPSKMNPDRDTDVSIHNVYIFDRLVGIEAEDKNQNIIKRFQVKSKDSDSNNIVFTANLKTGCYEIFVICSNYKIPCGTLKVEEDQMTKRNLENYAKSLENEVKRLRLKNTLYEEIISLQNQSFFNEARLLMVRTHALLSSASSKKIQYNHKPFYLTSRTYKNSSKIVVKNQNKGNGFIKLTPPIDGVTWKIEIIGREGRTNLGNLKAVIEHWRATPLARKIAKYLIQRYPGKSLFKIPSTNLADKILKEALQIELAKMGCIVLDDYLNKENWFFCHFIFVGEYKIYVCAQKDGKVIASSILTLNVKDPRSMTEPQKRLLSKEQDECGFYDTKVAFRLH